MQQEPGSITNWLSKLQAGQSEAAEPLWKRYQAKLVSIATQQLDESPDRSVDGEDLVQSSFGNVCLAVQNGKYPDIDNREDLWGLLYIATVNRVRQYYRELNALKRSHGSSSQAIDPSILADLQTPFAEAQTADLIEYLLSRLDLEDPSHLLRQIALLYLDDYSASSIAKLLHKRKTSVLISLRLIRSIWQEHQDS
jgi:DNA-directed RNA polymerase specialized sigma24 family protein